jgi:uncharacterized cofD-like protein
VVSIGGGTGLSALLQGLKEFAAPVAPRRRFDDAGTPAASTKHVDITAVVTVSDDGGSSGRLRREFDVLPPGDIRNCMVALSEDGALLSRLFQYRFQSGHGLRGHSFGNLFLTALTHITGDFNDAVRHSSEVLAILGKIYPATANNVVLEAVLEDGTLVSGETNISKSRRRITRIRLKPRVCRPLPDTLHAIERADLITLGPGSLFTSVIPNLLVSGIPAAIRESRALKAYFVNLMWQPGETTEFRASDHIRAIQQHAGEGLIDYAVVNVSPITASLRRRYARQKAQQVENDLDEVRRMGVEIVMGELVEPGARVRHDPAAVARIAMRLAREGQRRRIKQYGK